MRNRSQPQSRVGRISCYCLLLVAPELARSQDAGTTLTLGPANLHFGSQLVGSSSGAQAAILNNKSKNTVTQIAISISGDFAQTNTCTGSLAPNATCIIKVSFSPTLSGARTGTLSVSSSATTNPLTASLSGTGYSLVSIGLLPSNPSIAAHTSIELNATGYYDDGSTANITTSVQWTSSAATTASVNTSGNVTGLAPGPATITAASGTIFGSTNVTVTSASLVSISIGAARVTLPQGISEQLIATGTFSDGTTQNVSNLVSWASSAQNFVTVSTSGLIFSVANGTSTITATLNSISGSKNISVTTVSLSSIAIKLPPPPVAVGVKEQLQATGTFSDGTTQMLTRLVAWSSSSPNVATVDTLGRATGVSAGSSTISATLGSKSGSTALAIKALTLTSISVQATNSSIPAGMKQAFTATGTFSDGETADFTLAVHWTSSAPAVATVSNAAGQEGTVQGVAAGSATISAASSTAVSGSATVTVTPAVLVSIAVTPANSTIPVGVTEQLIATGTFGDGSTQNLTDTAMWSSSMPTVAPVGVGLAQADAVGTTTIMASYPASSGGGSITGSTSLNVAAAELAALIVAPEIATIEPGKTLQFSATGVYTDASMQILTTTVTWSSSATTIAKISNASGSQGLAAGYSAGSATIQAKVPKSSIAGSASLTVSNLPAPKITSFSPPSSAIGATITITGTNLQPGSGTSAQVMLSSASGGLISAPVSSTTATTLMFVVPAGAATGAIALIVNGGTATSITALTINPSTTFTLTAAPSAANLIQGQSVAYAVSLASTNGFTQLATLAVSGVPSGITAALVPSQITVGQTSILTLTAPAAQPVTTASLSVSASASVNGISVSGSATLMLSVQAPTTSFIGRTVVSNTLQTPIAGVTVTMLGNDGNGNSTNCTENAVSDAAGNFALLNLSQMCTGPQLVGFNGTTATAPPGQYAGVNLMFTLVSGQVTASPVLVHLPQINKVETFNVQQNASMVQNYSYQSIPGLSVTVYAGTTFTLQDGTQPNPFPLAGVEVPVDRLPDAKPFVPTMMRAFIVAFQPANANASQPVAVTFPNTLNTPPGTDMPLMTLSPIYGQMVPYGTGSVSADGTQIVPDPDPSYPGHLFGLVHFDWHGPMPPPPPTSNPSPSGGGGGWTPTSPCTACPCPDCPPAQAASPVDLASGLLVNTSTDISISGPRGSVALHRIYRSSSSNPGPFGLGTSHNYNIQLNTFAYIQGQGVITLVMPDGNQFPFNLTPSGTFTNTTVPSLRGAVLTPAAGAYSLRWLNGTVYQFQTSNLGSREAFLTAVSDANGNTTSLALNPSQPLQITQITDPVGRSLNLAYDGSNRIVSVTDPIGRTLQYTYNAQGTLATFTNAAGGVTTYGYDSQNNLNQVTDPRGIVTEQTTFNESFDGRVMSQQQADGGTFSFKYTLMNPLVPTSPVIQTVVTDPLGNQTTYRFNSQSLLTDATDPSGQTRTLTVNANSNNLVSAYTGSGTCSVCGNVAVGNTSFTFDSNGNTLTQTDSLGNVTQHTYDPVFNKVTSTTDPLGKVTTLTYDTRGNLLTVTDPNNHTTSYQYNSFGQVIQMTDPLNNITKYAYDSFGNLSSTTDALNNTTTFAYDAVSREITTTDVLGRRSLMAYDALDRIISQTNAQNGVTSFSYDPDSNLQSLTDARNNTTSFTYDGMNRLLTRTTPLGTSDSRKYDVNGNLVSFTDRRGQVSTYTYDVLNRRIGEQYQDSTVTLGYDSQSRLNSVRDTSGGSFSYAYDAIDSHLAIIPSNGAISYGLTDAINSTVVTVDPSGTVQAQYYYDAFGQTIATGTFPFQYTGRVPVSAGLYYYRARFYSPAMGRFISEDPFRFGSRRFAGGRQRFIGWRGLGLLAGNNLYAYAANRPTLSGDPLGELSPQQILLLLQLAFSGVPPAEILLDVLSIQPPAPIICAANEAQQQLLELLSDLENLVQELGQNEQENAEILEQIEKILLLLSTLA